MNTTKKYAVVDLEATGITTGQRGYIIQIGIVFVENGQIQDGICLDIQPPQPVDPFVSELTGITNEQLAHAPLFEEVADYLWMLLEDCIFVAHNIHFDYTLLKLEFERIGKVDFSMVQLDTIELSKMLYPLEKSYGLHYLSEKFSLPLMQAHHAGEDARATAHLFVMLMQRGQTLPLTTVQTIQKLLEHKGDAHALFFAQVQHLMDTISPLHSVYPIHQKESQKWIDTDQLKKQTTIETNKAASNYLKTAVDRTKERVNKKEVALTNRYVVQINGQSKQPIKQLLTEKKHLATKQCLNKALLKDIQTFSKKNVILVSSYEDKQALHEENVLDVKPPSQFLYRPALTNVMERVHQLTLQEIRQLIAVIIWQLEDTIGDLSDFTLTKQLKNQLTSRVIKADHVYFLKHFSQIMAHKHLIMTYEDFEHLKDVLQEAWHFSDSQLIVSDVYEWVNYLRQHHQETLTITNWLLRLLQDKDTYQEQERLVIDHVIDELKYFLYTMQLKYKVTTEFCEYETYFIGKVAELDKMPFIRLKNALQRFVNEVNFDGYQFVQKSIRSLQKIIISKDTNDYLVLEVKGRQYNLLFSKFSVSKFVYTTVIEQFERVMYCHLLKDTKAYVLNQIGESNAHYCDTQEPSKIIHVVTDCFHHTMKENLIIKKIARWARSQRDKKTLLILPSLDWVEKMKEVLPNASYTTSKNSYKLVQDMEETASYVACITFDLAKRMRVSDAFDTLCLAKLPFQSPDSLEARVSKHYLAGRKSSYFDQMMLPKMASDFDYLCDKYYDSVREFILLDERVINSVYANRVKEILSTYHFVETTVERMEKQ